MRASVCYWLLGHLRGHRHAHTNFWSSSAVGQGRMHLNRMPKRGHKIIHGWVQALTD
jgi:hypothetical protein